MTTQNQVSELYLPNARTGRSWRETAEEASKEHDSKRLLALTDELLDALTQMDP